MRKIDAHLSLTKPIELPDQLSPEWWELVGKISVHPNQNKNYKVPSNQEIEADKFCRGELDTEIVAFLLGLYDDNNQHLMLDEWESWPFDDTTFVDPTDY